MKHIKRTAWLCGLILWLGQGWFCFEIGRLCPQEPKLPTIKEVQQMVGAYPDGKLGKETERLWNRAICNQIAAKNTYDENGRPE